MAAVPIAELESTASTTLCGSGKGMAVCPELNLVATSCGDNTVSVFSLPTLDLLYTMDGRHICVCEYRHGRPYPPLPAAFVFSRRGYDEPGSSGHLAFTASSREEAYYSPRLLVTRFKSPTVTIIDLTTRSVEGAFDARLDGRPLVVASVACRGKYAALSLHGHGIASSVQLFQQGPLPSQWEFVRDVSYGQPRRFVQPYGLCVTADGSSVIVAETAGNRVSRFSVQTGAQQAFVHTDLRMPVSVQEIAEGTLVAHGLKCQLEFIPCDARAARANICSMRLCTWHGCLPVLAWVPGVGLLVRCNCQGGQLRLCALPDSIVRPGMSPARVSWMVAVARGMLAK